MKKYTMEDFAKGKFAIRVNTTLQLDKFKSVCADCGCGLHWVVGPFAPAACEKGSPLFIRCNPNTGGLVYTDERLLASLVSPIVDFAKMFQSYQILIDCDGTTTTATMTINGREVKTAIARKNPADKFDWRKGAELAFERLWNSPKKAGKKSEVREVIRWAEPGEYIKIVNVYPGYQEAYHNGDIFQVTGYRYGIRNGWVSVKGTNIAMRPEEYIVLEGYRP